MIRSDKETEKIVENMLWEGKSTRDHGQGPCGSKQNQKQTR